MSEEKLKPCPLCGGNAILGNLVDIDDYYVSCSNRKCQLQQIANYTPKSAVDAWNARPAEDALLAALKAWKEYESSIAPSMSWNELEAQVDAAIAKAEGDQ